MKAENENPDMLVSTPTGEDSFAKRLFCGVDLAAGPDQTVFVLNADAATLECMDEIRAVWERVYEMEIGMMMTPSSITTRPPDGRITVDGASMAYWLPPGVTLPLGASDARAVPEARFQHGASAPQHSEET